MLIVGQLPGKKRFQLRQNQKIQIIFLVVATSSRTPISKHCIVQLKKKASARHTNLYFLLEDLKLEGTYIC